MAKKKIAHPDPLKPSTQLIIKLGSAVCHAQEFMSPGGHEFDKSAFDSILNDKEVLEWLTAMTRLALLPLKRN